MKQLAIFILVVTSHFAQAQVFQGPLSRAMGGTGRAGLEAAESALLNPALVPLATDMEFNLFYGDGSIDRKQHRNHFGIGVADSSPDVIIPGSLHYIRTRETGTAPSAVSSEIWHVALGKMLAENFSVGASVYRLISDPDGMSSSVQWNGSLGALYSFDSGMGIAYVLDNILKPPGKVPVELRRATRQSVAAMYSMEGVGRLRFDVSRDEKYNPDKKMIYQLGLESRTTQYSIVRLGAKWDNPADQNLVTFGLGFNGPRLKLDYTIEKNICRTGEAVHSVDMRVPF